MAEDLQGAEHTASSTASPPINLNTISTHPRSLAPTASELDVLEYLNANGAGEKDADGRHENNVEGKDHEEKHERGPQSTEKFDIEKKEDANVLDAAENRRNVMELQDAVVDEHKVEELNTSTELDSDASVKNLEVNSEDVFDAPMTDAVSEDESASRSVATLTRPSPEITPTKTSSPSPQGSPVEAEPSFYTPASFQEDAASTTESETPEQTCAQPVSSVSDERAADSDSTTGTGMIAADDRLELQTRPSGLYELGMDVDSSAQTTAIATTSMERSAAPTSSASFPSSAPPSHPQVGGKTYYTFFVADDTAGDNAYATETPSQPSDSTIPYSSSTTSPRPMFAGKTCYPVPLGREESLQSLADDTMDVDPAAALPGPIDLEAARPKSSMDANDTSIIAASAPDTRPSVGGKTNYVFRPPENVDETETEMKADDEYEEDDSIEDEDDDDDASSSASEGENLKEDLLEVLDGDFNYKGSYAYSSLLPEAPNPVLHIDGVGQIGLPLAPRDARLIISSASQAPFGHGIETKVDTNVRHTWEIQPQRVSFRNPVWERWMRETVVKNVASALGVTVSGTPPRCDLYKLLLYEPGSHFLPHQDTVKAQNMFATIIIVLPSHYTGGQVHVSHSDSKQVFAFDANSLLSTAVMAWYTDVQHEVKPITSGYRLALSYNLVHVTPGIPPPMLPDTNHAVTSLRRVLSKWRQEKYYDDASMVGYILGHQYSPAGMKEGFKALKGEDAHMVAQLMPLAEEQGFFLGLANLSYHQVGSADCEGGYDMYNRGRRGRGYGRYGYDDYDDYDEDEDDMDAPGMDEVHDTDVTVKNLVDMQGGRPAGDASIPFDEEDLLQQNYFEDMDPDTKEYEGYMGNYPGDVEYCKYSSFSKTPWYKCTILVIMPEYHARSTLYSLGGSNYALDKLRRAVVARPTKPSADDLSYANFIVHALGDKPGVLVTMAQYAVQWSDLGLWEKALGACSWLKNTILPFDELVLGWKTFGFPRVYSSFEALVKKAPQIKTQIDFLRKLACNSPLEDYEMARRWSEQLIAQLLANLEAPTVQDVPLLIEVTKRDGLSYITNVVIPRLERNEKLHDFWVALVKALEFNRATLISPPGLSAAPDTEGEPTGRALYENMTRRCLDIIVRNWDGGIPEHSTAIHDPHSTRVAEILDLCIDVGIMDPCKDLLDLLMKKKPPKQSNLQTLYSPIISRIRQRLADKKDLDLLSGPFADFMEIMLQSLKAPSSSDVPWIIDVLQAKSVPYMMHRFIPRLEKNTALYHFWLQFITSLVQNEDSIAKKSPSTDPDPKTSLRKLIEHCLFVIVTNWEHGLTLPRTTSYNTSATSTPSRITELVELCISAHLLDPLTRLWSLVLKAKPLTLQESFRTVYNPLIPQLRQVLSGNGLDLASPPFAELIQVVMASYLRTILGGRPPTIVQARKLGCGCTDCQTLDNFLMSPQAEQTYRLVQSRRTHLEDRIKSARDLVSFSTNRSGTPHGLVVKKMPSVVAWGSWTERQSQAMTFLGNIGDANMLAKIAGPRYADVMKALQGNQRFVLPWNTATSASNASSGTTVRPSNPVAPSATSAAVTSMPTLHPAPSSTSSRPPTSVLSQATNHPWPPHGQRATPSASGAAVPAANSEPAGSKKRKKSNMVSTHVIDLTGED